MGFVDAITDPSFFANGGFLQAVPIVPATLPTLLQRVSQMIIAWVLSSILLDGYSYASANSNSNDTTNFMSNTSIKIFFSHCIIRIIFYIISQSLVSASLMSLEVPSFNVDGILDLVRQFWFTFIFMFGFRFLYDQRFKEE